MSSNRKGRHAVKKMNAEEVAKHLRYYKHIYFIRITNKQDKHITTRMI